MTYRVVNVEHVVVGVPGDVSSKHCTNEKKRILYVTLYKMSKN